MNIPLIQAIVTGTLASGGIVTGTLLIYDPDSLRWYGNAEIFVKAEYKTVTQASSDAPAPAKPQEEQLCRFVDKSFSKNEFKCIVYSTTVTTPTANKHLGTQTFNSKVTSESSVEKGKYYKIFAHRQLWNDWVADPTQKIEMSTTKGFTATSRPFSPIFTLTDTNKILEMTNNNVRQGKEFWVGKGKTIKTVVASGSGKNATKPKAGSLTKASKNYVCSGYEWGNFSDCKIYDFGSSASSTQGPFAPETTTETNTISSDNYYKIVGDGFGYDPLYVQVQDNKDADKIISIMDIKKSIFIDNLLFIFDAKEHIDQ